MKKVDRDALRRAIKMRMTFGEAEAQQITAMLGDTTRSWEETALFAAYSCQFRNLRPHQPTPSDMGDARPTEDVPGAGRMAAWELRRRLLACGLSEYEPDPVAALQAVEEAAKQGTTPKA
jgi:hypothetical protein